MLKEEADRLIEKSVTEMKLKDYSPRTIDSYLFFLRPFLESQESAESMNLDSVKKFLADLIGKYSNKSRSLATSSLRFFFKRVLDKPDIYVKLEVPKKQETLPIVLSPEEVSLLIDSAEHQKSKLIIKLLYSAGLRVSELVNLKPQDLDFSQGIGWVRKGKGRKDRLFKIADSITSSLQKHLSKNPENKFIFSQNDPLTPRNIQRIIKKAAKKAGINKKVTPHTMRHSFATHLLDAGENLLVIQQLLGHKNLETTKIYTHISQEQLKNVKSPLDRL